MMAGVRARTSVASISAIGKKISQDSRGFFAFPIQFHQPGEQQERMPQGGARYPGAAKRATGIAHPVEINRKALPGGICHYFDTKKGDIAASDIRGDPAGFHFDGDRARAGQSGFFRCTIGDAILRQNSPAAELPVRSRHRSLLSTNLSSDDHLASLQRRVEAATKASRHKSLDVAISVRDRFRAFARQAESRSV